MASTKGTGTGSGNSLPLYGRVAIVTGGSRGIGRAIATHIASLGANVVIGYLSNSSLAEQVTSEINISSSVGTHDVKAIMVKIDITVPDDLKAIFDVAENTFGSKVHIMINSAGILDPKYPSLASTSIEDFDSTIAINTRGAFLCCREAANRLTRDGGGRIVMITSAMVGVLKPGYSAYAASKSAVEAMVKVLAKELKGTSITANCVAPGPVATDMFVAGKSDELIKKMGEDCPFGRLGEPKDVSNLVSFLVSDVGEWINGQVIRTNGGAFIV
ncbi:Short-chain dehydrogenase/reductase family protein [Zostera marina]|uniref:Short-chain dehydrogenase/reductase family protein n=1 Tax=Zostera marina TaxID=29655 RepID=A0A0K9Q2S7_ZOSMR|nr:Short-chain dehydrogenase/reductase family protein [Zostera marina]